MIRIAVCGAAGRMGGRILLLASQQPDIFAIAGAVEYSGHPLIGKVISEFTEVKDSSVTLTDSIEKCADGVDVVIDFSAPTASIDTAQLCKKHGIAVVIGTTGISDKQVEILKTISSSCPMVYAPNMSVGVNLLFNLVRQVASVLDDEYDIEIVEAHHRFKKDAPSGTAKRLAEIIAQAKKVRLDDVAVHGRHGIIGERKSGEIGIHAVRMGNVVGDHTVSFGSLAERIELTHKAQTRDTFAQGALRAARFIAKLKPGFYDMQDVLGLK